MYNYVILSKYISHALRHVPWLYELELDDEGWADINALLIALKRENNKWNELSIHDLSEMIKASDKKDLR